LRRRGKRRPKKPAAAEITVANGEKSAGALAGARTRAGTGPWPLLLDLLGPPGSAALIADTPSTPAILQMGCEKSLAKLGTGKQDLDS